MFQRVYSLWQRFLWGRLLGMTAQESSGADERRVWVRHAANMVTRCVPAAGDGGELPLPARIVDISVAGIRLVVGHPFQPGDVITVELPTPDGLSALGVLAIVVHDAPHGLGQWILGCRFSRELNQEDLCAFGLKSKPVAPADSPPVPTDLTAVCRLAAPETAAVWPAEVEELSSVGIGLRVDQAVPVGALLSVRLSRTNRPPHGIDYLACVVHALEEPGGQRLLGCDFIRDLKDDELSRLLSP